MQNDHFPFLPIKNKSFHFSFLLDFWVWEGKGEPELGFISWAHGHNSYRTLSQIRGNNTHSALYLDYKVYSPTLPLQEGPQSQHLWSISPAIPYLLSLTAMVLGRTTISKTVSCKLRKTLITIQSIWHGFYTRCETRLYCELGKDDCCR